MRTVVVIQCALHLRKSVADEDCVGSKEKSRLWEHGCVDVDGSVHFGEVFQSFSKEKFRIAKRGVLWFVAPSVDGGMREIMLNPVLSLALLNNLVSCVRSIPCVSSPF